ncbi:3-methyl-2-oxobutanoate hydroxymethyltransferase PanB [Penicillium sp. IBT 35674x]|nr:3-methyl-2-oxobutanoate hydroxymethyltransferase PanB [Penicillium sp. IBT 35674x]
MGKSTMKTRKKMTIQGLVRLYEKGEPISVLTAHDFPSASVADVGGMDIVLVGDSLAMVALGMEDTNEVLVDEMLLHCRSVSRAVESAFTIGDLPMGSYEVSPQQAMETAVRFVKEGRMKGVKLEGGKEMAPTIKRITDAGIPVMAHIGLTPKDKMLSVDSEFKEKQLRLLRDALAVQEAGASMILIEAVPAEVAALVTSKLRVPTIGIGSGNGCSGQVLVQVDMMGNFPPGRFLPKFVKTYANVWTEALQGVEKFRDEVKSRAYPSSEYTYSMPEEVIEELRRVLK